MNRDNEAFENLELGVSEAIGPANRLERSFLDWLKTDSRSSGTHPRPWPVPGEKPLLTSGFEKSSADDPTLWEVEDLDPLLSEELQFLPISEMGSAIGHATGKDFESSDGAGNSVSDVDQLFRLGDISVISERSQTIIKSRLRTEIEHHPPLFPWETEILDYEAEGQTKSIDFSQGHQVPDLFNGKSPRNKIGFWAVHLSPQIDGLVTMPQEVLTQLLEQCTQAVTSNLREWAKLVDVVEKTLFPGRHWELNQIANRLSIAQQHRSSIAIDPLGKEKTGEIKGSISYEVATPSQQMLMSLLAAQEIMGNLTLELSSTQPRVEREWLTAAGLLTLELEYSAPKRNPKGNGSSEIKVRATLPCGGSVSLRHDRGQTKSERSNAGNLSVELLVSEAVASGNRDLNQNYLLEVRLQNSEPNSWENALTFAVCLMPSGKLRSQR